MYSDVREIRHLTETYSTCRKVKDFTPTKYHSGDIKESSIFGERRRKLIFSSQTR
jgi:hypothetical protein